MSQALLYRYVLPGLDHEPHLVTGTPRTVAGVPMVVVAGEDVLPARFFHASIEDAKREAADRLLAMVQPVLDTVRKLREEARDDIAD